MYVIRSLVNVIYVIVYSSPLQESACRLRINICSGQGLVILSIRVHTRSSRFKTSPCRSPQSGSELNFHWSHKAYINSKLSIESFYWNSSMTDIVVQKNDPLCDFNQLKSSWHSSPGLYGSHGWLGLDPNQFRLALGPLLRTVNPSVGVRLRVFADTERSCCLKYIYHSYIYKR